MIENISDTHQIDRTEDYREKDIFCFFPFISTENNDFTWVGFKYWFKTIKVKQQRIFERYANFDSGWSYQYVWNQWKSRWVTIEILPQ